MSDKWHWPTTCRRDYFIGRGYHETILELPGMNNEYMPPQESIDAYSRAGVLSRLVEVADGAQERRCLSS